MRRLIWLPLLAVFVAGCSSDGNTPTSSGKDTIFGIWEVVEVNGLVPERRLQVTYSVVPDVNVAVNDSLDAAGPYYEGHDGCNSFGGSYTLLGNRVTSLGASSTLVACLGRETVQHGVGFATLVGNADWSVDDGMLTLIGDLGITAVLRAVSTNPAVGVWQLAELDGRRPESEIAMDLTESGYVNGYAGCFIAGAYVVEGNEVSVAIRTPPGDRPPLELLCDDPTNEESQLFSLLAASGVVAGDELRFTNDAGVSAVFHRA